jgi:hypothetical protein
MHFDLRQMDDLYTLQTRSGLDAVTVDLSRIKLQGLAHLAIRMGYNALAEGGTLTLRDGSASSVQAIGPFLIGWPSLRALAIRALARDCRLEPGATLGEMVFTRTAPAFAPGWSAGIIFSGQDKELPALYRCLDGLTAQPELLSDIGEILVCGPTRDMAFLQDYPQVRYVVYDIAAEHQGPFPISAKKNHLMRAMRFDRRLVLHARIVMAPGALTAAPAEFDILAPNVIQRSDKGQEANIGLITIDPGWPEAVPRRFERSTLNVPADQYLRLMAHGRPYVDGGAFAVSARVFDVCPLNDGLLWGDCEDVEWGFRAQTLGFAIDMCPRMEALNTVSKVRTFEALPRPTAHALRAGNRVVRILRNLRARRMAP